MSSIIRYRIEQRFKHMNSLPWSSETPAVYEKFSNYCRATALMLAREGNFNDAFSIANLMESLWIQNETPLTWTLFYTDIVKAILSQQQQYEAILAVRSNERGMKSLRKTVKILSPSDALQLSTFLKKCNFPSK
ncbi:MAG: hypothetical protein JSS10_05005 [Verrucomicrobia bacterium]|nr:hypothetical protein [Verrucomicrobiota bacterium]